MLPARKGGALDALDLRKEHMKAVIMAGGRGTRFWPLSREGRPKQFIPLFTDSSLLQETVRRLTPRLSMEDVFIACGERYVDLVRRQLPDLPRDQIIVEPVGRNTAPCAGLAALVLRRRFGDETVALLPSDHRINRIDEFLRALDAAEQLTQDGWLVTFGIRPTFPATGYGYLKRGSPLDEAAGFPVFSVDRFVEKPELDKAREFLRQGSYDWNSGMFVFKASRLLEEIGRHMPELDRVLGRIESEGCSRESIERHFPSLPSESIDFGVMERAARVAVVPCNLGWSDVGGWRALYSLLDKDGDEIASNRPTLGLDCKRVLVFGEDREKLTAMLGIEDLIVIDTRDALLICPMERSEEVKRLVEELRQGGKLL